MKLNDDKVLPRKSVLRALLSIAIVCVVLFLPVGCRFAKKVTVAPTIKVPQPVIRVKLKGNAERILLGIDGAFEIYDSKSQLIAHGNRLKACYCSASDDRIVFGKKGIFVSDYCDIVPKENGVLRLEHKYYRGSLRIYKVNGSQILAVNHVPIEDYLKGVLPGELPSRFESETFKAQAICARTFALYEKYTLRHSRKWDVLATEASQVYLGKSVEISKANRAVDSTRGIVLTGQLPNGKWKIFPTYYSSTCGGRTQSASSIANISYSIKPLRGGVKCDTCNISPYYRWTNRKISSHKIAEALKSRGILGADASSIEAIEILKRTPFGRIGRLAIISDTGERVVLKGERFRLIIGSRVMPSTWCDIIKEGQEYLLTHGRGLGHGVGMCQYGAEGLARKGYTALEILYHYYPESKAVRVY